MLFSVSKQLHDLVSFNIDNFAKFLHSKYTIYDKEDEQDLDQTDLLQLVKDFTDSIKDSEQKVTSTVGAKRGRKPKEELGSCSFILTKGKRNGEKCSKPNVSGNRCKNHKVMVFVKSVDPELENENEKRINFSHCDSDSDSDSE
jgi:hypothetical protein